MDKDQITALAREYAEEATKADASNPNLSDSDLNGIKRDVAEYAAEIIRWLSQRFYLADKEKAKAFYNGNTFRELDFLEIVSCRRVLKSLFPEIAKEVER